MKKHRIMRGGLAALALLLLLTLSLLVGCDENNSPDGQESDSETVTTPVTEAETTLADRPAAEVLDEVLADDEADTAVSDNSKLDIDMSIGIFADANGVQNNATLPFSMSTITDGENMQLKGNLMGTEIDMTYVDGMLYMTMDGENVKCQMTAEEFASVVGSMMSEDDDSSTLIPDTSGLEALKPSEVFASVTSELDATNGDLLITCKGFNKAMASTFAPMLQPMLESFGMVGGEWDENGELIEDPAATLTDVVTILHALDEETLSITFVVDKTGIVRSASLSITFRTEETEAGITLKTSVTLSGTVAMTEGGQTVAVPAGGNAYPQEDWRVVFGQETADMVGLVPDRNGYYRLNETTEGRTRQLEYLYMHADELTAPFKVGGYVETIEYYEDSSSEAYIYLNEKSTGEPDYVSMIYMYIPGDATDEAGTPLSYMIEQSSWNELIGHFEYIDDVLVFVLTDRP